MSNTKSGALYYFTLAMTFIYVLLGIYIMLSKGIENMLPGNKKYIIGSLLILYAFYRAYRLWRINKSMQNNNENQ